MTTETKTRDDRTEEILSTVEDEYGFRPNLIEELVEAPAAARVYLAGQDAMADSSLSPAQQQAVQLTVAIHNDCHYCDAAHTSLGGQFGIEAEALDAIRDGGIPGVPELRGVVRATRLVLEKEGWLEESDLSELADEGIDRQQLYEVIAFVALKTLSNYVNHIADTEIDPQFS